MGELIVHPWSRYGKDRLYVNDTDGSRVGWYDLQTGVSTIERAELSDAFAAALQPYVSGSPPTPMPHSPAPTPTSTPELEPELAPTASIDLAGRRPGEGLRVQADEAWQSRKEQSRLLAYAGRVLDVHTDERAWRRGAEGEEAVGALLDKFSSHGWRTLHSVPVGRRGSDIDHVVIGPGGVFTVNTKNHRGKRVSVSSRGVWLSGHRQHYLRNSEHEASRASRLLSEACGFPVIARGVVVIFADDFRRKEQPQDVTVLASGELRRWLKKRPQVLDAGTISAVYEQARRGEIWTG